MCRNGSETRELVRAHIRGLRASPCLRDAQIVFIGENNLGSEVQEVSEELLRDVAGVVVISQTKFRYGVRTDQRAKRAWRFRFGDLLAHDDAIRYHSPLISVNPLITNRTPEQRALAVKTEFERQLRSLKCVFELPGSVTGETRAGIGGKYDQNNRPSARLRDDMAMAALFGIYWAGEYIGDRTTFHTHAERLVRANAPSIAPVVRHTEYGGEEFASRAGATQSAPEPSMNDRLASAEPHVKRRRVR
jgi:hypothetical protein